MSDDLAIGDRVRVIAPASSVFRGYEGVVAHFSKRGRKRRLEYALRLPDHPWQLKAPEARWFFNADELERVEAQGNGSSVALGAPERPSA